LNFSVLCVWKRCVSMFKIIFLFSFMLNAWSYANAQELTLEAILQKAVATSPDLQIAHQDIEIGKADINIAKADYFPTIKAQWDTEYLRDLEKQVSPVVVVGNTFIPSGTRYQNSAGLSLNHTLIDFGIRKRKVQSAKADVLSKAAIYDQSVRDMKLKLMDLYSEALLNYKAMLAHQAILDLAKQGYQMKRRLTIQLEPYRKWMSRQKPFKWRKVWMILKRLDGNWRII
jgi:outer membrane protein TolC